MAHWAVISVAKNTRHVATQQKSKEVRLMAHSARKLNDTVHV